MAKKKKAPAEPAFDYDKLAREMEATRLKHQAEMITKRDVLFDKLKEFHVVKVTFEYSGGGDSGQIDNVTASAGEEDEREVDLGAIQLVAEVATQKQDEEGNWLHVVTKRGQSLEEAAEDLAYDYLGSLHGGWENNDGGFGSIVFDVPAGKIRISHSEYVQETNTTENEL